MSFEVADEVEIDIEALRNICNSANSEESYFSEDHSSEESDDGFAEGADDDDERLQFRSAEKKRSKMFPSTSEGRNLSEQSFLQSVEEDEWENDDDNGYIVVPISSEEFFEMEEVSVEVMHILQIC